MGDTSIVKIFDSTTVIKSGNEQIILIQDFKKESVKDLHEIPWITSLIIPILVAAGVAWIANMMNKKKNKLEIDKLKEETSNLKKTFQPIVIGTLQSIQDKIITFKIDALKNIIHLRNDFVFHEQQYYEGDPATLDIEEYLEVLFYNFSQKKYQEFNIFHHKYSYLFPNFVFDILNNLQNKLAELNDTKKSFDSFDDQESEPSKRDREEIRKIIQLFDDSILAIRKDCHLDSSFIHDFIEQNK